MSRADKLLKSDYQAARALLAWSRGEDSDHGFAGALLINRIARAYLTPPKKKQPTRRRG